MRSGFRKHLLRIGTALPKYSSQLLSPTSSSRQNLFTHRHCASTPSLHKTPSLHSTMAKSKKSSPSTPTKAPSTTTLWPLLVFAPIAVAMLLYGIEEFDPAALPDCALARETVAVPKHFNQILNVSERIGDGLLPEPEDIVYDAEAHVIYMGCVDGWIKRVTVTESTAEVAMVVVENWVYVGGRPLGLALGPDKELVVAESSKGLMNVSKEGEVKVLTDEADGQKFGITDGVDVAQDGVIYFTDASHKYNMPMYVLDVLEGRPHGRLMSYDPLRKETQVLVHDLYFANGVAISPQQDHLVFCETFLRRCRKYYIQGEKKGSVANFVERLPGYPDNIHYDAEKGHYWLALSNGRTLFMDLLMRYPPLRKAVFIMSKFMTFPRSEQDGGVLAISLDGDVIALYSDPHLGMVTSGLRIREHLYHGSLGAPYISRINLAHLPSSAT